MSAMPKAMRVSLTVRFALLCLLVTVCTAGCLDPRATVVDTAHAPLPGGTQGDDHAADWEQVETLKDEQKFEAASDLVAELLTAARETSDQETWTRALIEETQLRTALHGYETAVRFLKDESWPEAPLWRGVLDLYYANSLVTYFRQYGHEIRRRERVAGDDTVDLKAWTTDQIANQAHLAFGRVWAERESWGAHSLGVLSRYIEQNTYPARIRGTLRDAVTYLWADLMTDTSLWRPRHENETFLLDVGALIRGGGDGNLELTDPEVHPLRRLCAILDDLEGWHDEQARDEAALETRLVRLDLLQTTFDAEADKLATRRHLESVLEAFDKAYPWWSMGQFILAGMLDEESEPDSRIRAHRVATAGRDRHPESVGGRFCAHLAASLEAPDYQIASMAADAAQRRSIRITHRNLDRLYFRALRVDLAEGMATAWPDDPWPDRTKTMMRIRRPDPELAWSIDLPRTGDYRSHVTYATIPVTEPGAYMVVASARENFAKPHNRTHAMGVIISDLVLVARDVGDGLEVSARSGFTGEPLGDVEVTLYNLPVWNKDPKVRSLHTGEDGRVVFELDSTRYRTALFARRGDDLAMNDRIHSYGWRGERPERASAYIYTDRSVYRPGQTIHWKIVAYQGGGDEPSYRTMPDKSVQVRLLDGNHREVAKDKVRTNDFGSVSGSFTVPTGRALGNWRLTCSYDGKAWFKVEEYKRPTFEVTLADAESPLRLNEPAVLGGEAGYYFGLPITSGDVVWRITRSPVYPRWWWWCPPSQGAQTVAAGRTELDADGHFTVSFTPRADERSAQDTNVTYSYRLSVDVTDEGGETRSAQRTYRLGFVSVAANIEAPTGFIGPDAAGRFTITRTDLDGAVRSGRGTWRLVALRQPELAVLPADVPVDFAPGHDNPYRTAGDHLRPRWQVDTNVDAALARWADGEELAHGELHHDEAGEAVLELVEHPAGAYRLHYETVDDFGATCRARHDFLIAGREVTPVNLALVLRTERKSVPVGETARLLVHSGLIDQEMVLEFFQDGRRLERRLLRSGRDAALIELPVASRHRGGFQVRLTALRDHQLMQETAQILVPWDDRKLKLEFATFRDHLRPGAEETFRITVRDADGRLDDRLLVRDAAEVLAYMYDRSLDIFAPHRPPQPLSLYPTRTRAGSIMASLGQARRNWRDGRGFGRLPSTPDLRPDRLFALDGYGIGGMGMRGRGGMLGGRGGRNG